MNTYVYLSRSVLIAVPGHMVMIGLTCTSGVVAFSYFTQQGCDPLKNGDIMNSNQVKYFLQSNNTFN